MISFVCWKWRDSRNGRVFESTHVNVLARAIARNYKDFHRVVCVTDEPAGLDPEIVHVPMPKTGFEHLLNPSERRYREGETIPARRIGRQVYPMRVRPPREAKPFPSCYRRLWNFSPEAAKHLGDRVFAIDIDAIPVGDLKPLVAKQSSFVGWCDPRFEWRKVAGGAYMLTTGAHTDVWTEFDPETSPSLAAAAGHHGSDQAWMSHKLYPPREHWSSSDGLLKLKWTPPGATAPPAGSRLIFTSGEAPPWAPHVQRRYPWIADHWK